MDYRQSGVNIKAGNEVVRRIKALAARTKTDGVLSAIGSFGGLFHLDRHRYRDPVLVASADGVGTKLRIAFLAGRHRTVGIDLVNHCVNDILVQGATPIFFLDYLATGRLSPDIAVEVVEGIAQACLNNGCALLGGETAEMPGFYRDREYDLAGFIVGVVEREGLITGERLTPGDVLIGLPSSGLHTNGYSLARQIIFDRLGLALDAPLEACGESVVDALLRTHRSYLHVVRPLIEQQLVKGMAHITGGGITENLPRMLPEGTEAVIDRNAWSVPAIFRFLQDQGEVPETEMYRTFNMGIGLVLATAEKDAARAQELLRQAGEPGARQIGMVTAGRPAVVYV